MESIYVRLVSLSGHIQAEAQICCQHSTNLTKVDLQTVLAVRNTGVGDRRVATAHPSSVSLQSVHDSFI